MREMFESVLILSSIGFIATSVLLLIKPFTVKKFPAKWQYYVWIVVLLTMIVPGYKFIPENEVHRIQYMLQTETRNDGNIEKTEPVTIDPRASDTEERIISDDGKNRVRLFDILAYIWLGGAVIFLLIVIVSYMVYVLGKRKNSVLIDGNTVFEEIKKEIGIKRNLRARMSPDVGSPMLVGIFFPVVYIPDKEISEEMLRLVFLHELIHYKRKDLIIKWLALFVNAVHWFNPMSYLLSRNVSEACEISCDMEVTKNMDVEHQKLYMKTILELVE